MLKVFRDAVSEIALDRGLQLYGAALAFSHALFWWNWKSGSPNLLEVLGPGSEPICWPFFRSCEWIHGLTPSTLLVFLSLYLLLAILVSVLFALRRAHAGVWGLLLLELTQLTVVLADFRLRQNHHYTLLLATLAFLFIPRKRAALKTLIVLFYLWSGTLKLNAEWISGDVFSPTGLWPFEKSTIVFATFYVIVLELALVWGLLSRRRWVQNGVLAQFVLFHLFSWQIVGSFYPLLMLLILSIFWIDQHFPAPHAGQQGRLTPGGWLFLCVFCLLQLAPYWFPPPRELRGEGRAFALYMFYSRVECRSRINVHGQEEITFDPRKGLPGLLSRIQCEPIVFWNLARNECRRRLLEPGFRDLDLLLESKLGLEPVYTKIIDLQSFCEKDPSYSFFSSNGWILSSSTR